MKEILFIHSSCAVGGIETFFIRLSKELRKKNIAPKFLFLYKSMTDKNIETQLREFGEVHFWEDISHSGFIRNDRAKLLLPLITKKVLQNFSRTDCIHADTALTFLLGKRIISHLKRDVRMVFGAYHANELAWSFSNGLPYYERYFRKKVFSNKTLFLFFNEFSSKITKQKNNIEIINEMIFPLGVDLPEKKHRAIRQGDGLKIISIGRLVSFKAYNLYMPTVINILNDDGIDVTYDVYGDGPLLSQLLASSENDDINKAIKYHGALEYEKIDSKLIEYDLFVGSGTAILHAAANGIPSVVAIENEPNHVSYGFFSDIPGIDYHEQRLPYDRVDIVEIVKQFISLSPSEREALSLKHIQKASIFDINKCAEKFEEAFSISSYQSGESTGFYNFIFWFFIAESIALLVRGERYSLKYDQQL